MVNQAFRIKIAYRSEKEKKKKEKIPGIGRYPRGPTKKKIVFSVAIFLCYLGCEIEISSNWATN